MHPESLDALGRYLFGARYVTDLAAALSEFTSTPVQPPHVSMWVKGRRRVPDWVGAAAFRVAERGSQELQERSRAIDRMLMTPWDHGMPSLPPTR
jgi:hypothetical protein